MLPGRFTSLLLVGLTALAFAACGLNGPTTFEAGATQPRVDENTGGKQAEQVEAASMGEQSVAQSVIELTILPSTMELPLGVTAAFKANLGSSGGDANDVTGASTWNSDATELALIEPGQFRSQALGQYEVTAVYNEFTAKANLTVVSPVVKSLTVLPSTMVLAKGETGAISISVTMTDDSTINSWVDGCNAEVTGDPGIITIHPETRTITGTNEGEVTVKVNCPGFQTTVSGEVVVKVTQATPVSLTVSPPMVDQPVGTAQQLAVSVQFSDGTSLDVTDIAQFASSDPTIVTVAEAAPQKGLVQLLKAGGSTKVSVTYNQGETTLTKDVAVAVGRALVKELQMTPAESNIAVGGQVSFVVFGILTDGSKTDLSDRVLSSLSDDNLARFSVNQPLTITTTTPGELVVSVKYSESSEIYQVEELITSATVAINAAELLELTIEPGNQSMYVNQTLSFVVRARKSDTPFGLPKAYWPDVTGAAIFTVSDDSIAKFLPGDANGTITGMAPGKAVVTANYLGMSVSATLDVHYCVDGKVLSVFLDTNGDGIVTDADFLGEFIAFSGSETALENYNYYSASAHPIAGPVPTDYLANVFFYQQEGTEGVYLNFFANRDENNDQKEWTDLQLNIVTTGNGNQDNVVLSDDSGELVRTLSNASTGQNLYEARMSYLANTDGGVIGPFFGDNYKIAITILNTGDVTSSWFHSADGLQFPLNDSENHTSSFVITHRNQGTCPTGN